MFLDDLFLEHKKIKKFLLDYKDRVPSDLGPIERFLEIHHQKEEELLFPLIERDNALSSGGPNCISYFSPRTMKNFLWEDGFHQLDRLLSHSTASFGEIRDQSGVGNTMLSLPKEDHLIGREAIKKINSTINTEEKNQTWITFSQFLFEHMEREDNCLFLLCESRLSDLSKSEYQEAAGKYKNLDL